MAASVPSSTVQSSSSSSEASNLMKALVHDRLAADGAVRVDDVAVPDIGDGEVLVRVRAASAKLYGWDLPPLLRSLGRLFARIRKPADHVPGLDFAGEVQAVGKSVNRFLPGAEVFGWSPGALAEYVAVPQEALAIKPARLSFAEAATVATSGLTALQALRKGRVGPGHDVLIVGASGAVGSFAVQLAKARGATVTGVCSTRNLGLVRALGADHVIDYTEEDFTRGDRLHDVIIDMAGDRTLSDLRRAMRPGATLVMVGQAGIPASEQRYLTALGRWLRASIWSLFIDQRLLALLRTGNRKDLLALHAHIEAGELTPSVDAAYPLDAATDAIEALGDGHARGGVVIELSR